MSLITGRRNHSLPSYFSNGVNGMPGMKELYAFMKLPVPVSALYAVMLTSELEGDSAYRIISDAMLTAILQDESMESTELHNLIQNHTTEGQDREHFVRGFNFLVEAASDYLRVMEATVGMDNRKLAGVYLSENDTMTFFFTSVLDS